MSEIEVNNVKNLLNNVSLISKKYDDLAEITGENFNIFNILGIYSSELNHSTFISNLLNVKGKHGQKDVFLKLFLEEISGYFNDDESIQSDILNSFKTEISNAETEKHIGKLNYENEEGGFIDVLINDGQNNIIIENKIWAGDQPKQLLRYNKQDVNAPIIYLTLYGKEPSPDSRGHLLCNKDFICISYAENIKNWLEKCIKEMANKPIIRETLNQYLNLVKQLTNQSVNNNMKDEIANIILKDIDSFISWKNLLKQQNSVLEKTIKNKIILLLEELQNEYKEKYNDITRCEIKCDGKIYSPLIVIESDSLKKKNLKIVFEFQSKNYNYLIGGYKFIDANNKDYSLASDFKIHFNGIPVKNSSSWPNFFEYWYFMNWTSNLEDLQNLIFGNFKEDLKGKIEVLLDMVK